jgi:hypothetical protein
MNRTNDSSNNGGNQQMLASWLLALNDAARCPGAGCTAWSRSYIYDFLLTIMLSFGFG